MISCAIVCTRCDHHQLITVDAIAPSSVTCRQCGLRLATFQSVGGYVYIVSNPSMPGLVKVGFTARSVKERIDELSDHTGVAEAYVEEWHCAVSSPQEAEKKAHHALEPFRYSRNREFFRISVDQAIGLISEALRNDTIFASQSVTPSASLDLNGAKKMIRQRVQSEPESGKDNFGGFGSSRYL